MAVLAVVHKAGLEAWLDPCDDAFVDVALALLSSCGLNIEVDQALAIDNCYP